MTAEGRRRPPRGLRPSRAESEGLLDGTGSGPLHELLAAASGPAHREEIAGEALATSAFVAAHRNDAPEVTIADDLLGPPATSHRRTGWWRTGTRLVAALVLALASAGVAVGTAATMLRDAPPAAPPPSSAPAPVPGGVGTTGPHPLTEPVRIATCRAWQAAGASTATNRTSDTAFTSLISAAGGTDNVDDYCAATAAPDAVPSPATSREHSPAPATSTPPGASRDEGASRPDDPEPAGAHNGNGNANANGNGNGNGNGNNSNEGRGVGPAATPPGRATDRSGPASGRAVGPPETPPGQNRANENDGSTSHGQG
ncbi:hypothetical protein [Actinomycetospora sp. NBC_00405]|uniref:hypothetical protein n=1 Tax=Actinomycetospora sp. NBC_00405 TaxID=2975952 RepID=UPI002E1BF302